jgi:hypothetical protein
VSACAELYVLAPERCEFRIPEACLNGQEQKRSVAPSDPCVEFGCCYNSGALFFGEECDLASLMPLRRDSLHALTVKRKFRFADGYILKERV